MPFSSSLLFGVCLLISFLYAGIEAGLLSLNRARVRSRVYQGDRAAVRLDRLLAHPGRLMATVLLVTNFADVMALVLITNAFYQRMGGRGCVVAGAIMLPVYLVGLQILPKSLFRRFPYRAVAALAGLLEATSRLLSPVLDLAGWLLRRGWFASLTDPARTTRPWLFTGREEFKTLVAEGERTGALAAAERGIIDNVLDFNAIPASALMCPTPETMRMHGDLQVAELLDFARAHRLDYVPVVNERGVPIALVDVFALLFDRDPARSAAGYLRRPPLIVAPDEPAMRVLRRLRATRLTAAAVIDGETNFVGIVRAADLVGRLVKQPSSNA